MTGLGSQAGRVVPCITIVAAMIVVKPEKKKCDIEPLTFNIHFTEPKLAIVKIKQVTKGKRQNHE